MDAEGRRGSGREEDADFEGKRGGEGCRVEFEDLLNTRERVRGRVGEARETVCTLTATFAPSLTVSFVADLNRSHFSSISSPLNSRPSSLATSSVTSTTASTTAASLTDAATHFLLVPLATFPTPGCHPFASTFTLVMTMLGGRSLRLAGLVNAAGLGVEAAAGGCFFPLTGVSTGATTGAGDGGDSKEYDKSGDIGRYSGLAPPLPSRSSIGSAARPPF